MNVYFYTLGCKVNRYETAAMQKLFVESGFTLTQQVQDAQVVVVNSCTVTASGDNKSLRCLRRAKRESPGCITVLCGCCAQMFAGNGAAEQPADIVVGTHSKTEIPLLVLRFAQQHKQINTVRAHCQSEMFENMPVTDMGERTRAVMKIEDGCERFCAYCVVPYARGPVRSMSIDSVKKQAAALAAAGYKEVVLSGINLCFYGREYGLTLADAVDAVCEQSEICRVRLSSVEPDMLSPELLKRLAAQPKLCAHFHMSMQSGCEATLKRMGRKYTPEQFLETAALIRSLFDRPTFTTDIIVGFPGETDEEFAQCCDFVEHFGFLKCHIFPYSRRSGTAAADFPDQIPEHIKKQRAQQLTQLADAVREKLISEYVHSAETVIAEAENKDGLLTGYTAGYVPVVIKKPRVKRGDIVNGTITEICGGTAVLE